jgi:small subunit ribosomal protein S11
VIHVQASFNNTIVTLTNMRGQVISWSSAGTCGFKGSKKKTPFAAQTSAENAVRLLTDQHTKHAEVLISGPGTGRYTALRAIRYGGIVVSFVRDVTPMPHNGCRPPKKRRI